MRRFCIWGGSAGWTWVGSVEDRYYVGRRRRELITAREAALLRRVATMFPAALVPLGVQALKLGEAFEEAGRALAAWAERAGRAFEPLGSPLPYPPPPYQWPEGVPSSEAARSLSANVEAAHRYLRSKQGQPPYGALRAYLGSTGMGTTTGEGDDGRKR